MIKNYTEHKPLKNSNNNNVKKMFLNNLFMQTAVDRIRLLNIKVS